MAEASLTGVVKYLEERAKNIAKYSDKLRDAVRKVDMYVEGVGKATGVEFLDTEPMMAYTDSGAQVEVRLAVKKRNGVWGIAVLERVEWESSFYFRCWLSHACREILKAAVKRLPTFIKLYADELEKQEKEIRDFAEKAEKIASMLSQ